MKALPLERVVLPTTGNLAFGVDRGERGDGSGRHIHRGIDLPRAEGTPVHAVADGTVEYAASQWERGFSGYGAHVVIAHRDGTRALYAHLQMALVRKGLRVYAGEIVGRVGRTAFTAEDHSALLKSGPHLHLEISPRRYPQASEATRLDPVAWLQGAIDPRVARAFAIVARASSLDVGLLRALSWVESKWNPAHEGSAEVPAAARGAGLFGFTPQQARDMSIDPKNPEQATAAAATILRRALARFETVPAAIAAFVWGQENVEHNQQASSWPAAVELYVSEVLGRYADERKALGAVPLEARGAVGFP